MLDDPYYSVGLFINSHNLMLCLIIPLFCIKCIHNWYWILRKFFYHAIFFIPHTCPLLIPEAKIAPLHMDKIKKDFNHIYMVIDNITMCDENPIQCTHSTSICITRESSHKGFHGENQEQPGILKMYAPILSTHGCPCSFAGKNGAIEVCSPASRAWILQTKWNTSMRKNDSLCHEQRTTKANCI